jgi:hypothetical protein
VQLFLSQGLQAAQRCWTTLRGPHILSGLVILIRNGKDGPHGD